MLDEEALLNQQATQAQEPPAEEAAEQPQEAPDQEQLEEQAGERASPQEQKMFDALAKQVLGALTSEQGIAMLIQSAKNAPPEEALAQMVTSAIEMVSQAATQAGIQIPPDVSSPAAAAVVAVLSAALADAGFAEDPNQLASAAMELINQGAARGPADSLS